MDKVNAGVETVSWINIAAGLAIAAVAWYATTEFALPFYSGVVAGLVLVLAGVWTAYDAARSRGSRSSWASGVCALTGVYIAVVPWSIGVSNLYFWASEAIGVGVAAISIYEIYAAIAGGSMRPLRPAV